MGRKWREEEERGTGKGSTCRRERESRKGRREGEREERGKEDGGTDAHVTCMYIQCTRRRRKGERKEEIREREMEGGERILPPSQGMTQ